MLKYTALSKFNVHAARKFTILAIFSRKKEEKCEVSQKKMRKTHSTTNKNVFCLLTCSSVDHEVLLVPEVGSLGGHVAGLVAHEVIVRGRQTKVPELKKNTICVIGSGKEKLCREQTTKT